MTQDKNKRRKGLVVTEEDKLKNLTALKGYGKNSDRIANFMTQKQAATMQKQLLAMDEARRAKEFGDTT